MLASYRALLCIFGSSLTGKFKRRPIYISCCGLVSFGTLLMASYCFFNQDKSLTNEFPYAKWIPIIAIVTCYSAFALGLGSIPYMFQVRISLYISNEGTFNDQNLIGRNPTLSCKIPWKWSPWNN